MFLLPNSLKFYEADNFMSYRASAAKDAASDKMDESKHDAKAEGHKQQT
jgi:hypothetical protein